jgi:hypothetical protein
MSYIDDKGSNFVQELTKDDILLGRGTGPNEYQGNIRFRALVKATLRSNEFNASTGSTKTMLARKIVHAVKAQNGRFLKKVGKSSTGGDLFAVVPDRVAVDKTRQSFRHQLKWTEDRKPKPPAGKVEQKQASFPDASCGSLEKLLPSTKSDSSAVLGAKGFGVMKEDEARLLSTPASGYTSIGLLCSPAAQKAKMVGLMDPASSLPPLKLRAEALWAGRLPPDVLGSSSAGQAQNSLFEGSVKQIVARYNQQYLSRLPFPPSLGESSLLLPSRMLFSSKTGTLDHFRFDWAAREQAARDLAYMEDLILRRAMNARY